MSEVDLRHLQCPMAFVQAKLALRAMTPESRLKLRLRGSATVSDLLRYARSQGYAIETQTCHDDCNDITLIAPKFLEKV
ncbi:sulfurtransferase TusA family protein [Ferrimonas aestuarii]|uniref:Sulfurtransferase TusA family protein n=1 Tax=Ferrimonas aestuarii TaxID=2569539 RepID=A0A4U1BMD6_9GAMM|nr:sulfurtransferase TusA family protein [Ferrimonas aestuarii]TKB54474.1 sulfurtransferase TusA family protein [Ferrimonas aestuarii]